MNDLDKPKVNEEKMQAFCEVFEKEILPVIVGEDGKGVDRLRAILDEKRKEVEKRKQAREANLHNKGGDLT